ncbi:MAG: zinc ribbon domain-containing protein [Synergistaceae bacterium]|nr:zinc ribbon domain-containing protein [Synergistaceae bacterium]
MAVFFCPSCNNKISGNVKNCPHCGFPIPQTAQPRKYRLTTKAIVFVVIIFVVAAYLERDRLFPQLNQEETQIQTETLKGRDGLEFTPDDIMNKLNSFFQSEGADSLRIAELVPEFSDTLDIYREIKDDVSISIATRKGSAAVISVSVSAQFSENPTAFMKYNIGLISIFNPTMKASIREEVLLDMMGYEDGKALTLREKHIYTIDNIRYIFTFSKKSGMIMLVEQMPKQEFDSGDISVPE